MKIAKYLLTIFFLLLSAFFVFIATQQNEYKISREKEINVEKESIYAYIKDLSTWKDWFDLKDYDKSAILTYNENKNPSLSWKSTTLNGKITITKSIDSDTIFQDILIGKDKHKITWIFTGSNKKTKVSWFMEGENSFKWKLNSFLKSGIDDVYGDFFEKGLNQIEENLTAQLSAFKIADNGIVTRNRNNFIQQKDSCSLDNFQKNSFKIKQGLQKFAKDNSIKTFNTPFIIVKERKKSKNYILYSVCIPIESEILIPEVSKVSVGTFEEYTAYKVTLIGNYTHLEKARKKAEGSILKLDYIIDTNNNFIEVYKVSSEHTKNASKWITELYFPVKKKYIKPIVPYKVPKNDSIKAIVLEEPIQ